MSSTPQRTGSCTIFSLPNTCKTLSVAHEAQKNSLILTQQKHRLQTTLRKDFVSF